MPKLFSYWHQLQHQPLKRDVLILGLSLLTSLWLWLEGGQVLDVESLQALWRSSTHVPRNMFEQLLTPIASDIPLSVSLMALFTTLSLWLFCRISLLVGIGPQTTLLLFLLLNFNPEFNDVRLQVSAFQPVLLLWLVGLYLFLAIYRRNIYVAFITWALSTWLAAIFVPAAMFWGIVFPLLFLFWPGHGSWKRRLCERGSFLLTYLFIIALLILFITPWREAVMDWLPEFFGQLDLKRKEMSFFINANNTIDLSIFEGFLLALMLVAVNAIKIMGPIIMIFALLAVWRRQLTTVLEGRVRLFFIYSLGFIWVLAAWAFMYYGSLPSDLVYTPITMLVLWLVSGVVFYALQRVKNGRIPPQRRLVLVWLMVAYALASIITFGPSVGYLREAGLWAQTQSGRIFSNSLTVLYYAGQPPFLDGEAYVDMDHPLSSFYDLQPQDLLLHVQGRKKPQPEDFELFDVLHTFVNDRGDKVYALRLKDE
ncbi:MAG: hypothetical protein Q4A74_03770 [Cardiobacteriaceae bacterium]|nr:hypothetical protein [Cardiobacteriaceae bacterium]